MSGIWIRDLRKKAGSRELYDNLSFVFPRTGLYAILGPSGCGKTSLLDLLAGFDVPDAGEVIVAGAALGRMDEEDRSSFRLRKIGYLKQGYDLLDLETVIDNVIFPALAMGEKRKRLLRRANDLLSNVGLSEKAYQRADTLSGGEKQRVALCRALIHDPEILLCDEPTGALDAENAKAIHEALASLSKRKLVLVVTHDETGILPYAEKVLHLENGKIKEATYLPREPKKEFLASLVAGEGNALRVPIVVWLKHAFHRLKAKRFQSVLSVTILSFALGAAGLSSFVSRDLKRSLLSSFSSLTGEDSILVECDGNEASLSGVMAASIEDAERLVNHHPAILRDYGVTYYADFETYFPDENRASVLHGYSRSVIPSLSVRSINEFLWLDEYPHKTCYPNRPKSMRGDEIVLGLPYDSMANLCFSLGILRDYSSLGDYVENHDLTILFEMENASWAYEDEQLFSIRAIVEESVPTIYHLDHLWNRHILEERMRFPASPSEDHSLPWIMQRLPYIEPKGNPTAFIGKSRELDAMKDFVFERASYAYERSHSRLGETTSLSRLYVFYANQHSLSYPFLEKLKKRGEISSYAVYGETSYVSIPDALVSGFYSPFFLGLDHDAVEMVADGYAIVREGSGFPAFHLPEKTVVGAYWLPRNAGLTFSSDFSRLSMGRAPVGIEEICLSRALAEKLGHPSSVFVAGMAGETRLSTHVERDYRVAELKVVGEIEEKADVLYGVPYWTIDFFRDILGMSAFSLSPTKATLYLKDAGKASAVAESLARANPRYRFVDASLRVRESIDEVSGYASLILSIASAVALAIAFFLLCAMASLIFLEQKREGRMLYSLGLSRGEISRSASAGLLLQIGASGLLSSLALVALEWVINRSIQSNFGTSDPFSFDWVPIFTICGISALAFLLSSIVIFILSKRRDFRREGR